MKYVLTILFALFWISIAVAQTSTLKTENTINENEVLDSEFVKYQTLYNDSTLFASYINTKIKNYNFCETDDTIGIKHITEKELNTGDSLVTFLGGETALIQILQQTIHYPSISRDNNVEGKVIIQFIVNEQDEICNVHIRRFGGIGLSEEALRVLDKIRYKWRAAKINGKKVKSYYTFPLVFKIS